jgi:hypothetical protein
MPGGQKFAAAGAAAVSGSEKMVKWIFVFVI